MFRLRTRAGTGSALALLAVLTLTSAVQAGSNSITLLRHPTEPGSTPTKLEGSPNPLDRLDFEASIREIYGRFTEITRKSGNEVRFVISDVVVYRPNQYDQLSWSEIGEVEPGPTIPTTLVSRERDLPSQVEYGYEAKWQEAPAEAAETFAQFQRSAAGMTLAQIIDATQKEAPDKAVPIEAVARFTVTTTLAGRSRTYKSSAFWRAWAPDTVAFWLSERVVSRVEDAWSEDRPIRPVPELDNASPAPETTSPAANSRYSCRTTSRFYNLPGANTYGFEGHTSGNHGAALSVPLTCSTTAACTSHCVTQQPYTSCTETGATGAIFRHEIHNARHSSSISGLGPGLTSECGYAWGCAVRECFRIFPFCSSIQFGVSGNGAQVALRADASALVDLGTQKGATCPAAIPIDDRDGPPCEEETPGMVALDLHGQGEPISLGTGAVKLRRLEPSTTMHHGHAVSYLMGEWALVSVPGASGGGAAGAEVQGATVEDFGAGVVAGLSDTLSARLTASASGKREALVVAVPLHEPNSRRIPLPALQLEAGAAPISVPTAHRGRALLLADFGEDHTLQKLSVLHSTAFVSRELALHFERSLKLTPQTAEPHRVVAFVLVDVGAKLEIVSQLMYLPRCCCGDYFCQ
jgi:hypothetical protein